MVRASPRRKTKKKSPAKQTLSILGREDMGTESQQISRQQTKHDVINDYSKMLNSTFPPDSNLPTLSDISKNFVLKPIDSMGNIFIVTKKTKRSTPETGSTTTVARSKLPSRWKHVKLRKPRPKSTTTTKKYHHNRLPVRINGKLALEGPPSKSSIKPYDIQKLMRGRIPMTSIDF